MPAYIVVEAILTDPAAFAPYTKVVPALVAKYGGEYLALGGDVEPLEGDWVHRWPSMEVARKFWYSEEYTAAKQLRAGTGEFRVMLVDGINKENLE